MAAGLNPASSAANRSILLTNGNIATTEKWDNSWYLGVSFNIGSINANNKHTVEF